MMIKLRKLYMVFKYKKRGIYNPFKLYDKLDRSQYWEREKMKNYQLNKINNLIKSAKKSIDYYKETIKNDHYNYKDLKTFSNNFPVTTKGDVKRFSDDLKNKKYKSITHRTSGSTGKPTTIEVSSKAEAYRIASKMRFYSWWGIDMFDKNVLIWYTPKVTKNLKYYFKEFEKKILGILRINVFDLNEKTILKYFNAINKFQPTYIRGYKSGVFELVRLMEINKLKFDGTKLKLVIVTSEGMLDPERKLIEKVLGCRVANEYGAADGGQYAYECPDKNLHINEDSVYISTDKDENAYVTEYYNDVMPLINYKNDDMIKLSEKYCLCGRKLKLIDKIEGRITDFITCKDGTKKNSLLLNIVLSDTDLKFNNSIKQFKTFYKNNRLIIHIIPGENFSEEVSAYFEHQIHQIICEDLKVEFLLVNEIKRSKSGKIKYFEKLD